MRINTKLEHRSHLGWLCNQYKFKLAAEIGTHQGVFADQFLSCFFGKLVCIDSWKIQPGPNEVWQPCFVEQNISRDFDRKLAELVLETKYRGRVSFLPLESSLAASIYPDKQFDFVYIDAMHDRKSVMKDLKAWWPKVKKGGILAGHDYDSRDPTTAGVVKAVNEFSESQKRKIYVTLEKNYPSWYMRKT